MFGASVVVVVVFLEKLPAIKPSPFCPRYDADYDDDGYGDEIIHYTHTITPTPWYQINTEEQLNIIVSGQGHFPPPGGGGWSLAVLEPQK